MNNNIELLLPPLIVFLALCAVAIIRLCRALSEARAYTKDLMRYNNSLENSAMHGDYNYSLLRTENEYLKTQLHIYEQIQSNTPNKVG